MRSVRSRASVRRSTADRAAVSAIEIRQPEIAARLFQHGLDLHLRRPQPLARGPETGDAFLEQRERRVELDVLGLELPDDLFQPAQILGDAHEDSTRAGTSPSATRRRNNAPKANSARRLRTWPSGPTGTAYPRSRMRSGLNASSCAASRSARWRSWRNTDVIAPWRRSAVRDSRSAARRVRLPRPPARRAARSSSWRPTSRRSATAKN